MIGEKPAVIFHDPLTDATPEVKERIRLAVASAESQGLVNDERCQHINRELRAVYGDHWFCFFSEDVLFEDFPFTAGTKAQFEFDQNEYRVFQLKCNTDE